MGEINDIVKTAVEPVYTYKEMRNRDLIRLYQGGAKEIFEHILSENIGLIKSIALRYSAISPFF